MQIKDFVLSLISAAAVTMICEGIMPEGGLKKYLKYIFALFILIVLLSPIKEIIGGVGSLSDIAAYSYDTGDSSYLADGIVAKHIKTAVSERFSIPETDIFVTWQNPGTEQEKKLIIKVKSRFGLIGEDIVYYTANNFGVLTEVIIYE